MKDAFAFAGLITLAAGCWLISPAVAGIVVGTLLLVGGLAAHFMEPRK